MRPTQTQGSRTSIRQGPRISMIIHKGDGNLAHASPVSFPWTDSATQQAVAGQQPGLRRSSNQGPDCVKTGHLMHVGRVCTLSML